MSKRNLNDQNEQSQEASVSQSSTPPSLPSQSTITQFQKNNPQQDLYIPSQNSVNPLSPYFLSSKELGRNKIDPLHRYKLMRWLQSQVFRQKYYREVFAFSAYYFDLYTSKIEKIPLNDLQNIGLACLLIATKIEGVPFPKLGAEFSMQQLIELQKRIAYRLNYFLYPKHHVYILNQYIQYWQKFIENSSKPIKKQWYTSQSLQCYQRRRSIFQKMDCIFMLFQSFNCGIERLTLNLFFLENKFNFMNINAVNLQQTELLNIIYESYTKIDEYTLEFHNFLKMWCQHLQFPPLDIEVGLKCAAFLALPISTEAPNHKCFNYNTYLYLSTFSQQSIKQLDRIAKKAA